MLQKMIIRLMALMSLFFAIDASAQTCAYTPGYPSSQAVYTFSSPGAINITGSEAVGTILWSSPLTGGSNTVAANCGANAGGGLISYWQTTHAPLGGIDVLPTNVPGIGYAIVSSNPGNSGLPSYPANREPRVTGNQINTLKFSLKLVRISGTVPSGSTVVQTQGGSIPFTTWYVGSNQLKLVDFKVGNITVNNSGGGGDGGKTCIFFDSTVSLGSVSLGTLPTGGASPGVLFNTEGYYCGAGRVAVLVVTNGTSSISDGSSCGSATMSNAGTARNIGITVSYESKSGYVPACWGQEFTPREFGDPSSGYRYHRFKAAMVRLADDATAGTVRGLMTIRMTYK